MNVDREIIETAFGVDRAAISALSDAELLVLADAVGLAIGEEIVKVSDRESAIERGMATELSDEYVAGVDAAAEVELDALPESDVSPDEADLAVRGVGERLMRDLEGDRGVRMTDALLAAVAALTLLGRKTGKALVGASGRPTTSIGGSLTQADRAAAAGLSGQQLWWIGKFWGAHLSKTISATITREALVAGLGRADVGRILRGVVGGTFPGVAVPGTWSGSAEQYFTSLAGTVRNQASNYGVLTTFVEGGVERYRIVAVLDKRTSAICFAPGTPVSTPSGEVPIETVRPGDLVLTGSGRIRRVRATSRRFSNDWRRVLLSSGRSLTVTPSHPFLLRSGWTEVGSIREEDEVAQGREVEALAATGTDGSLRRLWGGVPHSGEAGSSVLLRRVLRGTLPEGGSGGSNRPLRDVRGDVRGPELSPPTRSGPVLLPRMSPASGAARPSKERARADLPDVRQDLPGASGGAPRGEAPRALLRRVPEASADRNLRGVRDGVRGRGRGAGDEAVLLDGVLSEIAGGVDAGTGDGVLPPGGGSWIRGGGRGREVERRLRAPGPPDRARGRRSVSGEGARPGEGERAEGGDRVARLDARLPRRTEDPDAHRGELPPREYLARARGFARVVAVERLTLAFPAINLDIEDDPTYVAAGCVVHNCNFMHGRTFEVRAGARLAAARLDAATPEAAREVSRWRSAASAENLAGDENPEDALERVGMALPPYHGHCRTTIDVA